MAKYQIYQDKAETHNIWIKSIPREWKIVPLKYMCSGFVKDGPHETPKFIDEGIPFLSVDGIQNNKLVFEGCRYISIEDDVRFSLKCKPRKGNILLGKAASVGKVAFVENDNDFNVWSPLAVINPKDIRLGRFIFYCLQSYELQLQCDVFSNSNTQKNLGMTTIDNLSFPYPSINEAEKISDFLDQETAKIDSLIAKQEKLIELLKEKRQAVISHAVTKGLNPNVLMKDSGVEWLGEVPEHWEIIKFDYVIDTIGDIDHYMPSSVDVGVPYVMTGDLRDFVSDIDFENCKNVSYSDYKKLSRKIKTAKDDIIFARYATIGTLSYVDIDAEFLVSYSCVTIKPNPQRVTGKYLFYYLKSQAFLQAIQQQINSNTQGNVGVDSLRNVRILLPSVFEQEQIIDVLKNDLIMMDNLIAKSRLAIQLMQERRTALISAAVTGKIDVRNWQSPNRNNEADMELIV